MTTAIVPFDYGDRPVRTVTIANEPWFVAADVCHVLGLSNVSQTVSYLDKDDCDTTLITSEGGQQRTVNIVSEFGLYDLVMKSRKPEAKAFKRWITHEVIPQIRRNGVYVAPPGGAVIPEQRNGELVSLEALRGVIDNMIAIRLDTAQAAQTATEARQLAERNEARLDALEGQHDWLPALAFARLNGLPTSQQWLNKLGRTAAKLARAEGVEPVKIPHPRFGTQNTLPEWAWKQAYESRKAQ